MRANRLCTLYYLSQRTNLFSVFNIDKFAVIVTDDDNQIAARYGQRAYTVGETFSQLQRTMYNVVFT